MESPYMTVEEARVFLRLPTKSSLYALVSRGRVPCRRVGRKILFHKAELESLGKERQPRAPQQRKAAS